MFPNTIRCIVNRGLYLVDIFVVGLSPNGAFRGKGLKPLVPKSL
jgi:hypothetical protein